jgi:hypothetical protein
MATLVFRPYRLKQLNPENGYGSVDIPETDLVYATVVSVERRKADPDDLVVIGFLYRERA